MRVLLATFILIAATPASATDPVMIYAPFVKYLSAMVPHYEPGKRESEHVEDRRGDPDKEWPVVRIPLPQPSRELRPLLPLPGVGRQVTHTNQR
jgi:hypothetical protein